MAIQNNPLSNGQALAAEAKKVNTPVPAKPEKTVAPAPSTTANDQVKLTATPVGSTPAPVSLFPQKTAFDPIKAGKVNTTQGISKANSPASIKAALAPTLKIIAAIDPEMSKAISKLDDNDFVLADDGIKDMFAKHDIYAAWVAVARDSGTMNLHFRDMVLDDRFWKLNDGEKASVLSHEMVHAGDLPIISNFEKLFGVIKNKIDGVEMGDPVEDRAYVYQQAQFEKLGIDSSSEIFWTVQTYLEDRGLIAPYKF